MLKITLILYAPRTLEVRKELLDELNAELGPQFPELNVDVRETLAAQHFVVEFIESSREQAKELEKICKGKKIPVTFKKMEHSP